MIGSRLGAYEILAELGAGGMGKVYRAQSDGTTYAVKVIHAHLLETPGFFKRFLREADIGATIQHQNVVRTYDCDALLFDGTQQNFLVMEYVEGQTLRDLLQELERVPEELCRHIGREVAKGLTAIHEAGVVHRDLKPENVLITAEHEVKIMDLGVARLRDEAVRLSQTGAFVGSVEYAAPEQFRSADGEPDGRADLHALGVILYELATGQHPYRDEDASRVIGRILNDQPRKGGELNPQLSPFFEELVQTLLAKDREARFDNAAVLADVLSDGEASTWWKERAKALRVETKRPLRRIRVPRETALYGRDDDLSWLQAAYEKAKAGEGQVLLIEGEAGIGKTRLVDEFVGRLREAGEDLNFLFGSYPPGGAATASGAFSEAYREQFGVEGLEDSLAVYIKPTPSLIPAFAAILKGEATPTGAEPLTKDSLQTVFVHATRGLAVERTTIVLIDDLHFAPEDGRALFASLALAVPEQPILLIGTMRPGVPEEWIAGITREEHADHGSLTRLGPKDLTRLLRDAFQSEKLATELGFRIAEKSDGNPFFAFEIIRGLRDGQFLSLKPDGTWVTTKVIQDIQVPSSVLDLVNARIADLSEDERDLIDVASCSGFEFEPSIVAEAAGVPRVPALKRMGQIERRHRLIRTAGRVCVFDHHQVQEAVYASLMPELREAYHAAIARALEQRAGASDRTPAAVEGALCVSLCDHFLEGGEALKALRYLDPALAHLEAGFLHEPAIALMDRFLTLPGVLEGKSRLHILIAKNKRLDLRGRRDEQAPLLEEAAALAEAVGDPRAILVVEQALGARALPMGDAATAYEHFHRAVCVAGEMDDIGQVAHLTGNLGSTLQHLGRLDEAEEHQRRALDLARDLGDRREEANTLHNLALARWALGDRDEAVSCFEESLRLAREIPDHVAEGRALRQLASLCGQGGDFHAAKQHAEQALELARLTGVRQIEQGCLNVLGNVLQAQGMAVEALPYIEASLTVARETASPAHSCAARMNLGLTNMQLGHFAEAQTHLEAALEEAQEQADERNEAVGRLNLATLWFTLGRLDRCRTELDVAADLARASREPYGLGYCVQLRALLLGEQGDLGGALDAAEEALALRRSTRHGDGIADSLILIGDLRRRRGDVDEAHRALTEAVTLARDQNRDAPLGLALVRLARISVREVGAARRFVESAGTEINLTDAHYHLWKATGEREHLAAAKRALEDSVDGIPEEHRAAVRKSHRIHRAVEAAWNEQGREA